MKNLFNVKKECAIIDNMFFSNKEENLMCSFNKIDGGLKILVNIG
jgi:hypothetical protein